MYNEPKEVNFFILLLYIYIYPITLLAWISQTLSLSLRPSVLPYCLSLRASFANYILCPPRADADKFLLVGQRWHVHVSFRCHSQMVHSYARAERIWQSSSVIINPQTENRAGVLLEWIESVVNDKPGRDGPKNLRIFKRWVSWRLTVEARS